MQFTRHPRRSRYDAQTSTSASRPHVEPVEPAANPGTSSLQRLKYAFRSLWCRAVVLPAHWLSERVLLRRQWERFYLVFGGHIFFQTLRTAVKLDLFTLLDKHGSLTRAEIARQLGISEQPARIVLLGCTAVGLLRKRGSRYSNTTLARRHLVRGREGSIPSYVELEHQLMYKAMPWMYESVRQYRNVGLQEFQGNAPTVYQRLANYPEMQVIFQEAMHELSIHANASLARFVDFSGVRHVVDVGGGDGTNAMALVRHWPHLRATVFDWPTVCEIARRKIDAAGLASQVNVVAGNCFADPFPRRPTACCLPISSPSGARKRTARYSRSATRHCHAAAGLSSLT